MLPHASRRAVLTGSAAAGAALLAATATGCGALGDEDATPAGVVDPSAPAVDADSDLVGVVAEQLAEALSLALATGTTFRATRPLTARFAALHRSHLRELGQDDDGTGGKVAGRAETARERLLRAEERLQQRLVRAALEAQSGALAQVFAAMAAGVAQQRAVSS